MTILFSFVILLPQVVNVAHSFAFVHPSASASASPFKGPTRSYSYSYSSRCLFETSSANDAAQDADTAVATLSETPTSTTTTTATTTTTTTSASSESNSGSNSNSSTRITVPFPVIHWTVPNYKVGYRDEDGNWYDADGPRNGPPQNYWRQMSDEREYNRDMDAIVNVLSEWDVQKTIRAIEKRLSTRKPSLSRKILGTWAPILISGRNVAYQDKSMNDDDQTVDVPFLINISRTDGRRLGPKTHYGVFDLKLEHDEHLTVRIVHVSSDVTMDLNLDAEFHTTANEENVVNVLGYISPPAEENENNGTAATATAAGIPLNLGSVTYITDYVMVQRNDDGDIDFWLRADDSYLGVKEE